MNNDFLKPQNLVRFSFQAHGYDRLNFSADHDQALVLHYFQRPRCLAHVLMRNITKGEEIVKILQLVGVFISNLQLLNPWPSKTY